LTTPDRPTCQYTAPGKAEPCGATAWGRLALGKGPAHVCLGCLDATRSETRTYTALAAPADDVSALDGEARRRASAVVLALAGETRASRGKVAGEIAGRLAEEARLGARVAATGSALALVLGDFAALFDTIAAKAAEAPR
jgi:hypothetical protein